MGPAVSMMRPRTRTGPGRELFLASMAFAALVLYLSWPLALHFSRSRVHTDLVGLVVVLVSQQPDRQQQVLKGDSTVLDFH